MKTLISPPLACRECDNASQFATYDYRTRIVTYRCALCGDEYFDNNLDTDYEEEQA